MVSNAFCLYWCFRISSTWLRLHGTYPRNRFVNSSSILFVGLSWTEGCSTYDSCWTIVSLLFCYELSITRASTWVEITKTCWNLRNRELSSEFLTTAVRDSWLSIVTQGADVIEGKKPVDCRVRGIENTKVIVNWRYLQDDLTFIYTTSVRLWKGIAKTNIWCDIMQYN